MGKSKLELRVSKIEEALEKHLIESGFIQTNLKWNTWMTCAVLVVIIGKVVTEFFKR